MGQALHVWHALVISACHTPQKLHRQNNRTHQLLMRSVVVERLGSAVQNVSRLLTVYVWVRWSLFCAVLASDQALAAVVSLHEKDKEELLAEQLQHRKSSEHGSKVNYGNGVASSTRSRTASVFILSAFLHRVMAVHGISLLKHLQVCILTHRFDGMVQEARTQLEQSVSQRNATLNVLSQMSVAQNTKVLKNR